MTPVTKWYLWDKHSESFQFNHIEDGHSHRDVPLIRFKSQESLGGSKWDKRHAYMDGDNVVHEKTD